MGNLVGASKRAPHDHTGVAGDWSVKDIVAHVATYERGLVEWLTAAFRGEALELPNLDQPNVDQRNAAIFSENRTRPLQDILQESNETFTRLLTLVETLPEEDLFDPDRTEWFVKPRWQASRPLWQCIADDSYQHYHQYIPDIRQWLSRMGKGVV